MRLAYTNKDVDVMSTLARNVFEDSLGPGDPAYLPDLAPRDFFLFPKLKKDIHGCHFWSDEEAVEEWVNGKDRLFQL